MEAIKVSKRLCQMAYDAGLPSDAKLRLWLALSALEVTAMFDPTFATWFKKVVVGFVGILVPINKTLEDLAARLQPTRPASALPAALRRSGLLRPLMALSLPTDEPNCRSY